MYACCVCLNAYAYIVSTYAYAIIFTAIYAYIYIYIHIIYIYINNMQYTVHFKRAFVCLARARQGQQNGPCPRRRIRQNPNLVLATRCDSPWLMVLPFARPTYASAFVYMFQLYQPAEKNDGFVWLAKGPDHTSTLR